MKKIDAALLKRNLDARALYDLQVENICGCAILVTQKGEVLYKNVFGTKFPNQSEPLTEDAIYRMASMTKPVTAVAVMQLVEQGLLDLQDKVEKFLPAFKDMYVGALDENEKPYKVRPAETPITVFHLLTHTSGLGTGWMGNRYAMAMTPEQLRTLDDSMPYYADSALTFEPFSAQEYSPVFAFDVLAKIVEIISGQDYETYLQEHIFSLCDMKDTTFVPSEEQWSRVVGMHYKERGKSILVEREAGCVFDSFPVTHFVGGAGLISTLNDYGNFAQMLVNEGKYGDNVIIKPESIRLIATPHVPEALQPGAERWGLGVRVMVDESTPLTSVGSYGWSGAYGTHFWVDPANEITAIYLRNSFHDGGAAATIARHFEQDVYESIEE